MIRHLESKDLQLDRESWLRTRGHGSPCRVCTHQPLSHFQARIYHEMNMVHDRNQVSAEFKAFDEQHPTNVTSKLAQML